MNWNTRWIFAASVALFVCSVTGLAVGGIPDERGPEFLGTERPRVGMHNDLPGVSFEKHYKRFGFDPEVFRAVMKGLELQEDDATVTNVSSEARVSELEEEHLDMVVASFSITPQRGKRIDFVGPYATTYQGFLVGPEGADIQEFGDLGGKVVCSWDGSTSADVLRRFKLADIEARTLLDASACVQKLREGEVDAVFTDQMILQGFADLYAADGLRVVPGLTIGGPQHYGIGLPKGHRADCLRLREVLKDYVESSQWKRDFETWLPGIAKQDPAWISDYRPSADAIDARSCRDSP
ncbi:transporter substrate-binding domain-containing protein [Streptomyces caniscabiei]|uniref:transporter substrate-binding domain-containing protein n=1 Tax=Streptomyces caniscabiei TaxID=2746961 RepID=UPI0029AB5137|nr:transporter substrate-binding domain-containing protein [Streptomyces caniscabiei]MDX2604691.1 transporter substrate-binding domain-containing protein [Streptomyces caniscabiei]MDX2741016.1 transporter substrate-binding domain-containing protein [Streptomyces caniscabiei]MDX2781602.1 transporter substrate-binding domain-containing protein [Streptomyces caniscabiei]